MSSGRHRLIYRALAVAAALVLCAGWLLLDRNPDASLVRSTLEQIEGDPALLRVATRQGASLYQENCAGCHGAAREGNRQRGAPNLADGVWLYGNGTLSDIETTVLYGIRSGHPRAHNLNDMPAFGRAGMLSKQDIDDVVEYVLMISAQPHDEAAARRGRLVYAGSGVCYDCHAGDAYGVADYGTPGLTGRQGAWLYGGDRETLHRSIYDGRHGLCPAWIGKLNFEQIRAVSVYLYETSRHD